MNRRVVITGLGFCTPVGGSWREVWTNLLAGRSGIGTITLFDVSAFPVRIGGEVRHLDRTRLERQFPDARMEKDRKIWLGLEAATQAVADAGLSRQMLGHGLLSVGVSLEAFFVERLVPLTGGQDMLCALARAELGQDPPTRLQAPLDRLTELLGDHYDMRRGRYTNCSACAAGAQAIGEAFDHLRHGTAQVALAGATDSTLNPLGLGGFSLLRILSTENDQPQRACRPFDATRQGTVLSEGAVFLVLESLEHARRRGAKIYAELLGYATSMDAYRVTDPEPTGQGAALSMARAIASARLRPQDIDCVNVHGTGTPKNDLAETLACKQILGSRAYQIPVTANKSMTGHLIATSGALECAVSALTLSESQVPPTINRLHPDPQCDLDYVVEGSRPFGGRTVLSNSFGFGGQNASLVLRRVEPE